MGKAGVFGLRLPTGGQLEIWNASEVAEEFRKLGRRIPVLTHSMPDCLHRRGNKDW